MTTLDTSKPAADASTSQSEGKLKLPALTALVVSALIAAGVFSLPQNMAAKAGAGDSDRLGNYLYRHVNPRLRLPDPGAP